MNQQVESECNLAGVDIVTRYFSAGCDANSMQDEID
jgi:hypothetical protein